MAVNGITLLNLSYDEALKLLQNTGEIVELTVSQTFRRQNVIDGDGDGDGKTTHSDYRNNCDNERRRNSNEINNRLIDSNGTTETVKKCDVDMEHIYHNRTHETAFDGSEMSEKKQKKKKKNDDYSNLSMAKSMPDLPKVNKK